MRRRTQLNINISPELLQKLKRSAMKSGKTLTTFVSEVLSSKMQSYNPNKLSTPKNNSIEERIDSIEEVVYSMNYEHDKL